MDPFISMIMLWGLDWAPVYWAQCAGQQMSITQNQALYSLLGTRFGGDGRTYFNLPDFRGRVPIGYGAGPGLTPYQLGATGGYEGVGLNINTMPTHTHTAQVAGSAVSVTLKASPVAGTETIPGTNGATTIAASSAGRTVGSFIYNNQSATVDLNGVAVSGGVTGVVNSTEGVGLAHENRQPYLAVNFIIALQGIYPSRP